MITYEKQTVETVEVNVIPDEILLEFNNKGSGEYIQITESFKHGVVYTIGKGKYEVKNMEASLSRNDSLFLFHTHWSIRIQLRRVYTNG